MTLCGSNVQKQRIEGNGLSLYIAKSVLDDAGCFIQFKSEENKGTTFIISIPMVGMKKREGDKDALI